MSLFTFNVNKNHIFFLLIFVTYFLRQLFKEISNRINKDKVLIFGNSLIAKATIIDIYLFTPSNLLVIFPYFIEKIRAKNLKKSDKLILKNEKVNFLLKKTTFVKIPKVLKLIILTSTFNFIPRIITFFLFYFVNDDSKFGPIPILNSVSIFYILATFLLSRIFLSSYFYRHHFVSLAINIFGLIINIIIDIGNLKKNNYIIIKYVIDIVGEISFSFASITGKFLLTYISPYALTLYIGLVQILYLIIIFIPLYFIERNGENIFANFFVVFDRYEIILLYIGIDISICCYGLFIWILLNKFSPNDYALSMMVEAMIDKLFQYTLKPETFKDNIFISISQIIIFILLIIGICIHNEIIIINKCGMNEYTKNKISEKGAEDFKEADDLKNIGLDDISSEEDTIRSEDVFSRY
jgi:hypothetical protein